MQFLKKYAAIAVLLLVFPIIRFAANNLILEADNEIYAYVPQESDFVVEINTRNFISEIAYQRIFQEAYFIDKVYPPIGKEPPKAKYKDLGIDFFEKVVLFREQWANETIWIAVMKYTDQNKVKSYFLEEVPEARFEFGDGYVIVQMTPSNQQEKLDDHLKRISKKEVKGFNERVNLSQIFNPTKEINCYIIPENTKYNQLIDGYLSFDFKTDHIAVEGAFTPVPEFNETLPIAYAINTEKAFSLRSSLNVMNSIYLFSEDKIENVPEYSQLAFDYNGVECKMIDDYLNLGYATPFMIYPQIDLHFDILEKKKWNNFFDSLAYNNRIVVDTTNESLMLPEGASFLYKKTDSAFELMQSPIELTSSKDPKLYFDLRMVMEDMINNTTFTNDEKDPSSDFFYEITVGGAKMILRQIQSISNIEWVEFKLIGNDTNQLIANGRIEMTEKNGQSMIESLSFGTSALLFLKDYF